MKTKLFLFTAVFCMCNQALADIPTPSFYFEFGGSFVKNNGKPKLNAAQEPMGTPTEVAATLTTKSNNIIDSIEKDITIFPSGPGKKTGGAALAGIQKQQARQIFLEGSGVLTDKIIDDLELANNYVKSSTLENNLDQALCYVYAGASKTTSTVNNYCSNLTPAISSIDATKAKTAIDNAIKIITDRWVAMNSTTEEQIAIQSNTQVSPGGHLKFGSQWNALTMEGEFDIHRINFKTGGVRMFYTDNYQMMTNFVYNHPMSDRISPYAGVGIGINKAKFKIDEKIAKQEIDNRYINDDGVIMTIGDLRNVTQDNVNFNYQLLIGAQIKIMPTISLNLGYKFLSPINQKGYELHSHYKNSEIPKDYALKVKNHFFNAGLKFNL